MSMTTESLIRQEALLTDQIKAEKFTAAIANAVDQIERIVYDLEALVIDYGALQGDSNFTEDGGDSYRLTYTHISYLAKGFEDSTNSNYTGLITDIDTAIQANGQAALTDLDKKRLRDAGRDFKKTETYFALSFWAKTSGLRPTNDGGFVAAIAFGSGRAPLLSQDDVLRISRDYKRQALNQIWEWLRDPDALQGSGNDSITYTGDNSARGLDRTPEHFDSEDFGLSALPQKGDRSKNPRERYVG